MMIYDFYILTTQGVKNATVESPYNFTGAPFGGVPYRSPSTCQLSEVIVDSFWNCVDSVLSQNSLESSDFIKAELAYSDGVLYGVNPE